MTYWEPRDDDPAGCLWPAVIGGAIWFVVFVLLVPLFVAACG